ncbi:MAG: Ldh family oxidoreductase [Pseudomonadota bacterium]
MTTTLSLQEVEDLSLRALQSSGANEANARSVAASILDCEAEGIHSHGLARLPTYCEHLRCGKVDGKATPTYQKTGNAAVMVDAHDGFAHPAIDLGLKVVVPLAEETGIAAMGVTNSYNCGVCGYHVRRIAEAGKVALGFVNAPASIAPWGGRTPVFGTNPISCGVPRAEAPPLVIDQSSSVIARSEVAVHASRGEPLHEGWALDAEGRPTTDPAAALAGSMVPSGGYKGAGIALIVEVMAALVTGAHLSVEASSFGDNEGGPPGTGQFFLAIDPDFFAGPEFLHRVEILVQAIESQEGTRLPGERRQALRKETAANGVTLPDALHQKLLGYCETVGAVEG